MQRDKLFLLHIRDAVVDIEKFIKGITKKEFYNNYLIQNAVIRQIEIIGEATKNLSAELKKKHSEVPWKEIAGMRDILIHEYFRVDIVAVWKVIKEDLPALKKKILEILKKLKSTSTSGEKD